MILLQEKRSLIELCGYCDELIISFSCSTAALRIMNRRLPLLVVHFIINFEGVHIGVVIYHFVTKRMLIRRDVHILATTFQIVSQ